MARHTVTLGDGTFLVMDVGREITIVDERGNPRVGSGWYDGPDIYKVTHEVGFFLKFENGERAEIDYRFAEELLKNSSWYEKYGAEFPTLRDLLLKGAPHLEAVWGQTKGLG